MKIYKLLLLPVLALFLVGCSTKLADPYKKFRTYSSAHIFEGGEKELALAHYASAAKHFEALDALYPFGPNAEQAQLEIIYAYYMAGDDASAITAADRYIRLYPRGKHVDYAYYMRGIVGFNLGLSWLQKKFHMNPASRDTSTLKQSFSSFATLSQRFPHSQYAPDSLVRMAYIRNLMAMREVGIAQFYMTRSAYVAAANRASEVVEHYQGSTSVPKALAIMVRAYRKLGLTKMADASYKLLEHNYSDTLAYRSLGRT
jgi:outer membrane protein assembly factor BamD